MDNFIYGIHCPKYINISSGVNRAILAATSDLSAMAAKPYCIFISITLNKDNISRPWDILKPKTQLEEGDSSSFYSYDEKKKLYTHVLHDSGSIGVFLKGFFGYNSNPNYIELVMWIMSLVYGLNLWRRFYY